MYVDDLLIASQDQKEGEDFLAKLMAIWKMKITGRIGRQTKGALEFLGRSIYRAKDVNQLCTLVSVDSTW